MTALVVITLIVVIGLGRRVVADAERMRLVAEAEHELRGPLQAMALALEAEAMRPDRRGAADPRARAATGQMQAEFERARIALADLAAARSGRRAEAGDDVVRLDRVVWRAATASDVAARRVGGGVHLDWSAGPISVRANHGRLTQALSNLLANAIEHGGGQIRVTGRRTKRGIRVEVRDSGRGHGLSVAAKAIRGSGGSLSMARAGAGTAVAIELPVVEEVPASVPAAPSVPAAGSVPAAASAEPAVLHLRAGYVPVASADPPAAA